VQIEAHAKNIRPPLKFVVVKIQGVSSEDGEKKCFEKLQTSYPRKRARKKPEIEFLHCNFY